MIGNAVAVAKNRLESGDVTIRRVAFGVADARQLRAPVALDGTQPSFTGAEMAPLLPLSSVDVVFTDRMLINLASAEEQLAVMNAISALLSPGKLFLMLENSVQTHAVLNRVRVTLGLPARPSASYNVFIDEPKVIAAFQQSMSLVTVDDFSALHDMMLYAIEPSATDGEVHYDSALMTRLTDAVLQLAELGLGGSGFGQNRLWVWRK
jgi:hypothetical protein